MSRIRADRYTNREGTGAPTFSEGVNVVGVTSMSGDLEVTSGTITGPSQLTISGITSSISDTATDVFVYDTSKDSDGGDWRYRTQNTSWYNETLNTATRGSRKEFPAVAVIVAEALKVTIYDGDDPDLPMWMVFTVSNNTWFKLYATGSQCSCITALNATLCAGGNGVGIRLAVVDFIKDNQYLTENGFTYYTTGIETRNDVTSFPDDGGSKSIVNNVVNDVAITVLPNAPIDDTTGLPIPTIAVATDGGTSIIKDDGTVVDITASGYTAVDDKIDFDYLNNVLYLENAGFPQRQPIPSVDTTRQSGRDRVYGGTSLYVPTILGIASNIFPNSDGFVSGSTSGLSILDYSISQSQSQEMIAYAAASYSTGWMQGDIQIATLSDTDATNQTGGTVPDRSVNSNALSVTGTITRTAVTTGADLVAYSGFSASNTLIDSSFTVDFGNPVTISIVFWQKITDITNYSYALSLLDGGNVKGGISVGSDATPYAGEAYFNMGSDTLYSGLPVNDGLWHCIAGTINETTKKFYLDGKLVSSIQINDLDMSGIDQINVGSFDTQYHNLGSLALMRVSKTAPSPEQINKMYEDEKYLFQENSQVTLYGSSNTVTALAYDDTTDLLHVGTSAGRSEFQGLRRINNTTVGITTAISASNELVAEQ